MSQSTLDYLENLDDLEWLESLSSQKLIEPPHTKGRRLKRLFTLNQVREIYILASRGAKQKEIAQVLQCSLRSLERTLQGDDKGCTDRRLAYEGYILGRRYFETFNSTEAFKALTLLREEAFKNVGEDCLVRESEALEDYQALRENLQQIFEASKRASEILARITLREVK